MRTRGAGLTIQNLHCSEVSRWPGDAAATLAGLRGGAGAGGRAGAGVARRMGRMDAFTRSGRGRRSAGMVQHFFPWWMEQAYVAQAGYEMLRPEELELMAAAWVDGGADRVSARAGAELSRAAGAGVCGGCGELLQGYGRVLLRGGGDRAAAAGRWAEPIETRRSGALEVWLPPVAGQAVCGGGGYRRAAERMGTSAAVQVIDLETGVQCAELRQQAWRLLELAQAAAELAQGVRRGADGGGAEQPWGRGAGVSGERGAVRDRCTSRRAWRVG